MTPPLEVRLRSATAADDAFIVEMARHACVIEDWPLPEPDSEETRSEAIWLNVHMRNPAANLYESKGFQAKGKGRGALGVAMLKTLSPRTARRRSAGPSHR